MSDPRVGLCLFADDIRLEVGNKYSLMGLYGPDINLVGTWPIVLPKLVFMIWLISDADDPILKLKLTIYSPPDKLKIAEVEVPVSNAPIYNKDEATKLSRQVPLPLMNVFIPGPGFIEVYAETERGEMRIGRLQVSLTEMPTVGAKTS